MLAEFNPTMIPDLELPILGKFVDFDFDLFNGHNIKTTLKFLSLYYKPECEVVILKTRNFDTMP